MQSAHSVAVPFLHGCAIHAELFTELPKAQRCFPIQAPMRADDIQLLGRELWEHIGKYSFGIAALQYIPG